MPPIMRRYGKGLVALWFCLCAALEQQSDAKLMTAELEQGWKSHMLVFDLESKQRLEAPSGIYMQVRVWKV